MHLRHVLIFAGAMLVVTPEARAQQGGLSIWLGVTRGLDDKSPLTFKSTDLSAALQFDAPLFPVGVRGEIMTPSSDLSDGPRTYILSGVVPLRMPALQPYGIVGYGIYGKGEPSEVKGISYGAGVRLGGGRLGIFGEVRRHHKLDRTFGMIGITL